MRQFWHDLFLSFIMGFVIPGLLLSMTAVLLDSGRQNTYVPEISLEAHMPASGTNMRILWENGITEEMDMDAYLVGVLLAEMPADFEKEALKAQAVIARTYARKAWETGGKHTDGSVCTASVCCQGYLSEEEYIQRGGTEESLEKIRAAVNATSGEVLTYDGQLIEATYFSCSGGRTEDAATVWGTDYPYLRSVESPGEEHAAVYESQVVFTASEFQKLLGRELTGSPESWFGLVTYTSGGGVAVMDIGGAGYSGTELRALLGLRSTAFSIETDGADICITVRGYGHRVGMSQYGADAMAASGSSFRDILEKYYPGTQLEWISEN